MCQKQQAPPSVVPQGGGASRRPVGFLLLAQILYDFSYMAVSILYCGQDVDTYSTTEPRYIAEWVVKTKML